MNTIFLTVEYDNDTENPLTDCDGMWTLYRFRQSSRNGSDNRDDFFDGNYKGELVPVTLDLFFKLRKGLAFVVYSSGGDWYISKHDTDGREGVLIWENKPEDMGAKTYEERAKDAQSTLDVYNKWANGECYWFRYTGCAEDSCGGFIGEDHLLESLKEDYLPDVRPLTIVCEDRDTESIVSGFDWGEGIEVLSREEYEEMCATEDAIEEAEGVMV